MKMWFLTRGGSIRLAGGWAPTALLALTALAATMMSSAPLASDADGAVGAAPAPAAVQTPARSTPVALTTAALQAPRTPTSPPTANPIAASESSIRAGRAVYAKICRACHGLLGKGDGPAAPPGTQPANLVDSEWKHGSSDADLFRAIKLGIEPYDAMEPWGKKLSDDDIWHTINFLRDLAKRAK